LSNRQVLALGQIQPVLGNVKANLDKHLEWVEKARNEGATAVLFPELGLTGYHIQDLTLEVARKRSDEEIQSLVAASRDIDVAFSFVEESDQHLYYIAAVYASRGEIQSVHRKVYLPTYGMFDEGRYLARGSHFRSFSSSWGPCGMMICEDAWHFTAPYLLSMGGAKLLILMSSSPTRSLNQPDTFGSQAFWHRLLEVYAQLFGVYIAFVNRIGFEDGVNFFGGSGVVAPDGTWLKEAPILDETLITVTIDDEAVRRIRYTVPLLRDERPDLLVQELKRLERTSEGFEFR